MAPGTLLPSGFLMPAQATQHAKMSLAVACCDTIQVPHMSSHTCECWAASLVLHCMVTCLGSHGERWVQRSSSRGPDGMGADLCRTSCRTLPLMCVSAGTPGGCAMVAGNTSAGLWEHEWPPQRVLVDTRHVKELTEVARTEVGGSLKF